MDNVPRGMPYLAIRLPFRIVAVLYSGVSTTLGAEDEAFQTMDDCLNQSSLLKPITAIFQRECFVVEIPQSYAQFALRATGFNQFPCRDSMDRTIRRRRQLPEGDTVTRSDHKVQQSVITSRRRLYPLKEETNGNGLSDPEVIGFLIRTEHFSNMC